MTASTPRPRVWWIARAWAANPLIRRVDRIEAVAVAVAIMFALCTIPLAVGNAKNIYASESRNMALVNATRHSIDAVALAPSASQQAYRPAATVAVHVQWFANNITRDKTIRVAHPVKTGEKVPIWVDGDGELIGPPSQGTDLRAVAVTITVGAWLVVVAISIAALALLRLALDRVRRRRWDRELRILIDNDGGWATRST